MSLNFEIGGIFKALQESHVTTKSKKKEKKKVQNNDSDSPTDLKSIDEDNVNAIKETLDNLFTVKPDEGVEEVDEDDEEYKVFLLLSLCIFSDKVQMFKYLKNSEQSLKKVQGTRC